MTTAELAPTILVMGKGGVGKTTVAAGLAVLAAQSTKAVTLVEFGDGEAGRRALAGSSRKIEHMVIRPAEALERGAAPLFGSAVLAKIVMGNFAMRPLLAAAPAIRELAMLEAVRQLILDRPGTRVVVDMPATGHSVAWLRVPRQGSDFLGSGPLFEMCDRIARELLVVGKTSIVVVSLPERLVIEETVELCASIAAETAMQVDRVVINRLLATFPDAALAAAKALCAREGPLQAAAQSLFATLAARADANRENLASLSTLSETHAVWRLPLGVADPRAETVADWLRSEGAH